MREDSPTDLASARLQALVREMVPEAGLEPARPCGQRILGPLHPPYASRLSGVQRELESRNGPMGSGSAFPESRAGLAAAQRRRDSWELPATPALWLFTTFAKVVIKGRLGSPRYKQITTGESREVL